MALAGILEDPSDTRILLQKHHLKWEKKEKKKKEKKKKEKKKKISHPDHIEKRKKEKQSMKGGVGKGGGTFEELFNVTAHGEARERRLAFSSWLCRLFHPGIGHGPGHRVQVASSVLNGVKKQVSQ